MQVVCQAVVDLVRDALTGYDLKFKYNISPLTPEDESGVIIGTESRGSEETLKEAGRQGRQANAPAMRRVNVDIDLTSLTQIRQKRTVQETRTKTSATTDWAISVAMSAAVEAVGSVGGIPFTLTNKKTGQTMSGAGGQSGFVAGAGIKTLGASGSFSEPTSFTTRNPKTWLDFNFINYDIRSHSIGILVVGYDYSNMKIYFRDGDIVDDIYIGGVTMGDLSVNLGSFKKGVMWLIGEPDLTYTERSEHEESEDFESSSHEQHPHIVLFDTGKTEITENEMKKLSEYVHQAATNYTEETSP